MPVSQGKLRHMKHKQEPVSRGQSLHVLRNARAAVILIQAVDRRHLDFIEFKIKDLAVFKQAVGADCLRNHADTLLQNPSKADLGHTAVMLLRDVDENVAVEICAARERRVRLNDNPILLAEVAELILAEKRMIFDLVDGRDYARVHQEIVELELVEIRDTDCLYAAGLVDFLQYVPGIEIAAGYRPVHEIEIDIVQAETIKAPLERALYIADSLRCVPDFGCDKELLSRNAATADSLADLLLIFICRCRVKQVIAHGCGVGDRGYCLVAGRLVQPEPEPRHFNSVVQRNCVIHRNPLFHLKAVETMKVTDIMEKRMSLSFEVFPPKTDQPLEILYSVLEKLYSLDPDFISCTYGAGGTNAGRHMAICEKIQKSDNRTVAISHFTCIGSTREDIRREMQASLDLGIDHVLALRGDIPKGWESTRGDFRHASELIAYLREVFGSRFTIAMAGAPEKHIEARSFDEDIAHLRMKQDAGADILMTQLCYDVDGFARWLERIRAAGITLPIDAGIMPVLSKDSVIRMCLGTNGCSIPQPLAELISRHYNDTPDDFRKAGIEYTIDLTYKFMNLGINGIHFYTMNKADAVLEICEGCGLTHRK